MQPTTAPGLTDAAVLAARAAHGRNVLAEANNSDLLATLREVVLEPMFLLLLAACAVYFAPGRAEEAITLIAALLVVAGTSVYQSVRSNQALGAARLSRLGVLTKQPQTAEGLGSATVICADKTGTLTQKGMRVAQLYDGATAGLVALPGPLAPTAAAVLACARYASETEPFDAMEKAIVAAFATADPAAAAAPAPMLHAYPLAGTPPMMTHIRQVSGSPLIAPKGAVAHAAGAQPGALADAGPHAGPAAGDAAGTGGAAALWVRAGAIDFAGRVRTGRAGGRGLGRGLQSRAPIIPVPSLTISCAVAGPAVPA